MRPSILVICGPTASGKSNLAMQLARELDGEIINADSMQIYCGMNIGTAKPTPEQLAEIPHHLIDVVNPDQPYSAADFVKAADAAILDISSRNKLTIVAGGTGLYIRALLKGLIDSPHSDEKLRLVLREEANRLGSQVLLEKLRKVDPESARRIHPNNHVRIIRALEVYHLTGIPLSRYQQEHNFSTLRYRNLQIGIQVDRSTLYNRIDTRVEKMLSDGLLDEVQHLLASGYTPEMKALRAIGYKESITYLSGTFSFDETIRMIKRNSRNYAKRQLTWFGADKDILWLEYPEKFDSILNNVIEFFD